MEVLVNIPLSKRKSMAITE